VSAFHPASATNRREAILDAALELFRERGFHSVGIDEIGAAAGISGPGVYRHFPSKSALLIALFDSISERILITADEIRKADCPPEEALGRLISYHVATAVAERALLAVWVQDSRSLPRPDQQRLRANEREYVAIWTAALVALRPELAPTQAEVLVHAALGAVNSVALHDTGLEPADLRILVTDAARAVLHTG
jgi:AcrR family transcriptional regulator